MFKGGRKGGAGQGKLRVMEGQSPQPENMQTKVEWKPCGNVIPFHVFVVSILPMLPSITERTSNIICADQIIRPGPPVPLIRRVRCNISRSGQPEKAELGTADSSKRTNQNKDLVTETEEEM